MLDRETAKAYLQRLSGGMIWITKAARAADVKSLAAALRPKTPSRPLVRIGPAGDGGYLLPDDLDGIAACVSPGVSTECGFDLAIAERGIDVYMADASVSGPPTSHPRFHFEPLFLAAVTGPGTVTLADYCARIPAGGGDLVLQMDIEYAEYPVLLSTPREVMERFRVMVIELHGLDNLFQSFGFGVMKAFFDKLLETHEVVHLHPNNCCGVATMGGVAVPRVMEMTLYRRDRGVSPADPGRAWPHPLDGDNVPGKPTLVLPAAWR